MSGFRNHRNLGKNYTKHNKKGKENKKRLQNLVFILCINLGQFLLHELILFSLAKIKTYCQFITTSFSPTIELMLKLSGSSASIWDVLVSRLFLFEIIFLAVLSLSETIRAFCFTAAILAILFLASPTLLDRLPACALSARE